MKDFVVILSWIAGLLVLVSLVHIGNRSIEKLCWGGIFLVACVGALARTGLG